MSVVILTGGTYGIGESITVLLAQRGHRVVTFGRNAANGDALRAKLDEQGLHADILCGDVSKAADVDRIVAWTAEKYGRVDGLVNNAAIGPLGTVLNTSEDVWDSIIDVNLKGVYLCARAVIPHMRRQGGGAIVNVGSGAGWGKPNMAAYAASKGGLFALGAALAYDHFHDHVRVNTVIPGGGGIVSGMSLGRVGGDRSKFGLNAPGTVAGRVANGEDLAKAIAFLLSDDAAAISGTIIDVGCFFHQGGPVPPKPAGGAAT